MNNDPPLIDRGPRTPYTIIWFHNGMTAVCDQYGEQMPEFQGRHTITLQALQEAGIDWNSLPEKLGEPMRWV